MSDLFKTAVANKYRFLSAKGYISTEDLFACSLEELNEIAKCINKDIKDAGEEDFIKVSSVTTTLASSRLEVVKAVIAYKLEQKQSAETFRTKVQEKQKLLMLLDTKEAEKLASLSAEELKARLAELG